MIRYYDAEEWNKHFSDDERDDDKRCLRVANESGVSAGGSGRGWLSSEKNASEDEQFGMLVR